MFYMIPLNFLGSAVNQVTSPVTAPTQLLRVPDVVVDSHPVAEAKNATRLVTTHKATLDWF
jgi:hypothetical protein